MAFMPQAVFANSNEDSLPDGDLSWEYDVYIGGTPVTRAQLAGEGWLFDPDTYTLTLRSGFTSSGTANLQDSTERAAVIYVKSDHSLTIELEGDATIGAAGWENALTADSKQVYGIYALSSNITITGSHTLDVYGSESAIWCKNLTVDGTKLNCRSYYTAVKVCSNAYSYFSDSMNGEDDMVVKNGAEVFAKTIHGLGIRPNGVLGRICHSFNDYGGGAGIFVNGSLKVENSTVDAENTCYELPPPMGDGINGTTTVSRAKTFCASICVHDDVVVSGNTARVTGKLENKADNFGEGGTLYSKLGAVMAKNFKVREGGTIEGFITSDYFTQVAQGLRRLGWYKDARYNIDITPASITLDGEGTVRNGINRMQSVAYLGTEEFQYTDIGPYVFKENTTATSEYSCYREVMITQSSGIYFRTTDSGQEWSFQSDFRKAYPLDSKIIDFRDFSNTVFVEKGWPAGGLIPYIYIQSGNWTVLPSTGRNANSYLETGSSLTVQYENGQTYRGGYAHVAEGATLKIQGDGISEYWNVMPYEFYDKTGGTVRFINGTVGCLTFASDFRAACMIAAVKLAVLFTAVFADCLAPASCFAARMLGECCTAIVTLVVFVFVCVTVIYRYGNFSRYIARLVGSNDFLCALCRRQSELIVLERNFFAVYSHAVDIFFVNRYSLRSTVGLAVFNAFNNRGNIIQHDTV